MTKIGADVIEAAIRILDPDNNAYPGLVLAGSKKSAERFAKDVYKVTEALAKLLGVKPEEYVIDQNPVRFVDSAEPPSTTLQKRLQDIASAWSQRTVDFEHNCVTLPFDVAESLDKKMRG